MLVYLCISPLAMDANPLRPKELSVQRNRQQTWRSSFGFEKQWKWAACSVSTRYEQSSVRLDGFLGEA